MIVLLLACHQHAAKGNFSVVEPTGELSCWQKRGDKQKFPSQPDTQIMIDPIKTWHKLLVTDRTAAALDRLANNNTKSMQLTALSQSLSIHVVTQ